MKIAFRVDYHTIPGQSLWIRSELISADGSTRIGQVTPMSWRNDRQWHAEIDVTSSSRSILEYTYELRQENNGLHLEEWDGPRRVVVDPGQSDCLLLHDTWCSAGTVDFALSSAAFAISASATAAAPVHPPSDANHQFRLRMAAVPDGLVPCLIGSIAELGDWQWDHAIPLVREGDRIWQTAVNLPDDWWIEYKYGLWDPEEHRVVSLECGENRILEPHGIGGGQHTVVADEAYRRLPSDLPRRTGIAIPVFSLRSHAGLGVGEFPDLKPFADWAHRAGLSLIQILPINDTTSAHDWTDSYPYSAISVFALHPIYLRIDRLTVPLPRASASKLEKDRQRLNNLPVVDHPEVMRIKREVTRILFEDHSTTIVSNPEYRSFLEANRAWLAPYVAFCVLRDRFGSGEPSGWPGHESYHPEQIGDMFHPDHPEFKEAHYHAWLQHELDLQLSDAVAHLHELGISLKGDLPIGVDRNSADAWASPDCFHLEAQAGAPPDAFAAKGQNWGFPTYNWQAMAADGYSWWRARLAHLGRYFDAFRIDHILGFFRIWSIPAGQIDGIMGFFDPAWAIHVDEIRGRGIPFDHERFCQPYLREHHLREQLGENYENARDSFLQDLGDGRLRFRAHLGDQRAIATAVADWDVGDARTRAKVLEVLLEAAAERLFLEVPGSDGSLVHPRCALHTTRSYRDLDFTIRSKIDDLYIDYFYRRQDPLWQACGYEKLPAMRSASRMLLCGEDLGMVPDCVPGVMRELGILSLEIQRMPKSPRASFAHPADAPYLSVVSPSTHDMPTIRGWWREDPRMTAEFAWNCLGIAFAPLDMTGEIAEMIIRQHLESPAMWAIFPLQDLLAIDEGLRHPDPDAERINIPAIMPYYWRYRMHMTIDDLRQADGFSGRIRRMVNLSGRFATPPETR